MKSGISNFYSNNCSLSGKTERLFVSLLLSTAAIRELAAVQNRMRSNGITGNYTPSGNMHITLAFIGETDERQKISKTLRNVSSSSFELRVSRLGRFESVVWAAPEDCAGLNNLAAAVRRVLDEAGIQYDTKPFKPHITLIRKPCIKGDFPGPIRIGECSFRASEFVLMKSERGRYGMIYTPVEKYNLS